MSSHFQSSILTPFQWHTLVPENAAQLKKQAEEEHGLCNIQLPAYTDDSSFVTSVINSINTPDPDCNITACNVTNCDSCNQTSCQDVDPGKITDYRNCDCDIVVFVNDERKLVLLSVAYKNESAGITNDIKLLGVFQDFGDRDGVNGTEDVYGLALNSPSVPAIVARFNTMEEFTGNMSTAMTLFTNVDTEITAEYKDSSFLLAIEFEKSFDKSVSFNSSISLGDFAEIGVDQSSLSVSGSLYLANTIGIRLSPDDTQSLKVVATMNDTKNCTEEDVDFYFNITYVSDGEEMLHNVTLSCVNGTDNRTDAVRAAMRNASGGNDALFTVSRVGNATLTLAFDPSIEEVRVEISNETVGFYPNVYGISNDTQTKKPFQILLGRTELNVDLGISGSADVSARIDEYIEVSAEIEAAVNGTVQLYAGSRELVPVNEWLSKLQNVRNDSSPFYDKHFARASVTVDGEFDASVEVKKPFELDLLSFVGEFAEPFELDLLNSTAINSTKPNITFDIDLPNIGDIGNLSFAGMCNRCC